MLNIIVKKLIAIAETLAIAIFFSSIIMFGIYLVCGDLVNDIMSLTQVFSIEKQESNVTSKINFDYEKKALDNLPNWGSKFATLSLPTIDRYNIDIYQGDSLDIIRYGAGHNAGTYFPGEGGSIVIGAHNSYEHFYYLPQVSIGDDITINTDYGIFHYKVYKTDIISDKDQGKLPINKDNEVLMLYTCYPVGGVGFKNKRYVVYASLSLIEDKGAK